MKLESIVRAFLLVCLLVSCTALVITAIFYLTEAPNYLTRTSVVDEHLNITFYPERNYALPGETTKFYFEITNKDRETMRRIDISVKISYFGKTVYEKYGLSLRDYKPREKITIFTQETLPIITPPGEYEVQLHFKPESLDDRYIDYKLYVKPSIYQLLSLSLLTSILGLLTLYFSTTMKVFRSSIQLIKNNFEVSTVGQKFISIGIAILIIAAFELALGLESLANEFALIAYLLLMIGVSNLLLEYIELGEPEIRYVLSTYIFSASLFLLTYNGISEFIGKTVVAFTTTLATFSFLSLGKESQRDVIKHATILLFFWVLYNLLQGDIPYYTIGITIASLLYLFKKELSRLLKYS